MPARKFIRSLFWLVRAHLRSCLPFLFVVSLMRLSVSLSPSSFVRIGWLGHRSAHDRSMLSRIAAGLFSIELRRISDDERRTVSDHDQYYLIVVPKRMSTIYAKFGQPTGRNGECAITSETRVSKAPFRPRCKRIRRRAIVTAIYRKTRINQILFAHYWRLLGFRWNSMRIAYWLRRQKAHTQS